jgi:NTP pyrophosphatase (non-canonical NTP hydrolase)
MDKFDRVVDDIRRERERQIMKWGEQDRTDLYWLAILVEEVGEVGRALVEGNAYQMKKELVQVAAVIVAWLENS